MLKFFNNIDRFVHRMLEAMCSLSLAVRDRAMNISQILLNTVSRSPQTGGLLKTYRMITL
jgi:hypothetical protein